MGKLKKGSRSTAVGPHEFSYIFELKFREKFTIILWNKQHSLYIQKILTNYKNYNNWTIWKQNFLYATKLWKMTERTHNPYWDLLTFHKKDITE